MDLKTAIDNLKEFLSDNLTDIYQSRNTEWIYTDENRVNLALNAFPRILIKATDVQTMRAGIGVPISLDTAKVQIKIKTLFGNKYTYENVEYTGQELAIFMADQISNLIKANHPTFRDLGFQYIWPNLGPTQDYDGNKNITCTITLDVQYLNS